MGVERPDILGSFFDEFKGKRVEVFVKIAEGEKIKEIPESVDISRSGMQPYLEEWNERGYIKRSGPKGYKLTSRGEDIYEALEDMDSTVLRIKKNTLYRQLESSFESQGINLGDTLSKQVLDSLLEESYLDDKTSLEDINWELDD